MLTSLIILFNEETFLKLIQKLYAILRCNHQREILCTEARHECVSFYILWTEKTSQVTGLADLMVFSLDVTITFRSFIGRHKQKHILEHSTMMMIKIISHISKAKKKKFFVL